MSSFNPQGPFEIGRGGGHVANSNLRNGNLPPETFGEDARSPARIGAIPYQARPVTPRIRSPARSAIMIVGALVLPRIHARHHRSVDDAQAIRPHEPSIRYPRRARSRRCWSDDRQIRVYRGRNPRCRLPPPIWGRDMRPRDMGAQRGLRRAMPTPMRMPSTHARRSSGGREVIMHYRGLEVGLGVRSETVPRLLGFRMHRAEGDGMGGGPLQALLMNHYRRGDELDVGRFQPGPGPEEAAGLGDVRRQRSPAFALHRAGIFRGPARTISVSVSVYQLMNCERMVLHARRRRTNPGGQEFATRPGPPPARPPITYSNCGDYRRRRRESPRHRHEPLRVLPLRAISTPLARLPSNRIFVVIASVITFRLGRVVAGCRHAPAVLQRMPLRWVH